MKHTQTQVLMHFNYIKYDIVRKDNGICCLILVKFSKKFSLVCFVVFVLPSCLSLPMIFILRLQSLHMKTHFGGEALEGGLKGGIFSVGYFENLAVSC